MSKEQKIVIDPAKVVLFLLKIAVVLLAASSVCLMADSLALHNSPGAHKALKLFYVDWELNVPTFFSAVLMLAASALLGTIFLLKNKEGSRFRWHWLLLALGFLFMSFDEIVSVHERLIEPVRAIFGDVHFGVLYFAWVIPAIFMVMLIGLGFVRFLIELPRSISIAFLIAATLFLSGAIGFELLEGQHAEKYGKDNLIYMVMTSIEEGLEMVGVIVFIGALLAYIQQSYATVEIRFAALTPLLSPEILKQAKRPTIHRDCPVEN